MSLPLLAVFCLAVACGGTSTAEPSARLSGCWHFTLDGAQAGGFQLSPESEGRFAGEFAYSIWTGEVLGSSQPDGSFSIEMHLPGSPDNRSVLRAQGAPIREPLVGTAVDLSSSESHVFEARRCFGTLRMGQDGP